MSSLVLVAKRLPVKAFVIGVLLLCISNALASTIDLQQAAFGTVDVSRYSTWDLGAEPNPNSTSRWVFDTVNSLLQHWPNTRYRNGWLTSLLSNRAFLSICRSQLCSWTSS